MALVWRKTSSLLTVSPSLPFSSSRSKTQGETFLSETYPRFQGKGQFSFLKIDRINPCTSSLSFSWEFCYVSLLLWGLSPELLGRVSAWSEERRGESEKDYTLGGSEREMGTPILNPLFSLLQVDSRPQSGYRDPLSRRPHREAVNTGVETKEGHGRFSVCGLRQQVAWKPTNGQRSWCS